MFRRGLIGAALLLSCAPAEMPHPPLYCDNSFSLAPPEPLQSIDPSSEEQPPPLSFAIDDPSIAGESELISEDKSPYFTNRWRARIRRFDRALAGIEEADTRLFPDRMALVRGDALFGLKRFDEARDAYREAMLRGESAGVREAAALGLAQIHDARGEPRETLYYLDPLLEALADDAEPELSLMRARSLAALARRDEARRELFSLIDRSAALDVAAKAEQSLAQIDGRRRLNKDDQIEVDRKKARILALKGRSLAALQQLNKLRAISRGDAGVQIELDLADLQAARGARSNAETILRKLFARRDVEGRKGEVLLRLGRLALDRFDFREARAHFAGCVELHDSAFVDCSYEGAEVDYFSGEYSLCAEKMFTLALEFPTAKRAPQALWMAGWSDYLRGGDTIALQAFERLRGAENATDEQRDAGTYWLGRTLEREGSSDEADYEYRSIVSTRPLTYYGLLARARLESRETIPLFQGLSPPPPAATAEEIAANLGPLRPIAIDRGVALLRARLISEGVEELLAAAEEYRRRADPSGMAAVIDLFAMFERDAWAFLIARNLVDSSRTVTPAPDLWRLWRVAYPTPFEAPVTDASRDHEVDPLLLYAVMRTESRFRADAVSPAGARGLMQLMPATARSLARNSPRARIHARRYRAPESNVWLGAGYLAQLLERYQGNVIKAIGAYNAGPGAMDRWGRMFGALEHDEFVERTPYDETRRYMRKTLESYLIYRRLYAASTEVRVVNVSAALAPTPTTQLSFKR